MSLHKKQCKKYDLPDGSRNPNCTGTFWVDSAHYNKKELCDSCQKVKTNKYHATYMREYYRKNGKKGRKAVVKKREPRSK